MRLGDLRDAEALAAFLAEAGLSRAAVTRQQAQFLRVAETLLAGGAPAGAPALAFFVPGRIEVLGKHTDYAGGRSLVCAVERGFAVVALPGLDETVEVVDVGWGETATLALDPAPAPRPGHWSDYARTVAQRVARNFPGALKGGLIAFASDLPPASGLSSSSALVVAVFLALSALNDLLAHPAYQAHLHTREDLAHYLGCVENGLTFRGLAGAAGVGTFGGSEDHTAILCAEAETLRLYAYAPTRFLQAVPVPADHRFVIGASGVVAEKAGGAREAYNRAARRAAAAAEAWRRATGRDDPHLGAAVATAGFSPTRMRASLRAAAAIPDAPQDLLERFRHFYTENEQVVPGAVEALATGDVEAFGRYVDLSQRTAEALLHNQIDETVFLARSARELGAVAASAFGAGFGGSVWALVPAPAADAFHQAWATAYRDAFPQHASQAAFFEERAGPAAVRLGATGH